MSRILKYTIWGGIAAVLLLTTACSRILQSLDVVGNQSVASFEEVLAVLPPEKRDVCCWGITSPDGEAEFVWSVGGATLTINAQPFIDAGLSEDFAGLDLEKGEITFSVEFNSNAQTSDPLGNYKNIVENHREFVTFHAEADHHALDFGGGNSFEWASDMIVNGANGTPQAADIVFVLNPEPLIAAGVDPEAVEGWRFVTRQMMGNSMQKFVKPFDLK